ncbi:cysteine hydrolase family protein [Parablautia muri]|uniref:Cysteine hydrolase n=1 Tax=Parablautia muri TaxID=2320879 RepID=A0A9X5BDW6_9FIRM|nr:cysteine hydrolase family protein [Parablautia muri]NBJ91983.1 cysteine hydrolase [Parablautia muri]
MVLLVVDTQNLIMNNDLYEFQTLVYRIRTLIDKARNNNIEVIYVRHDDGIGQKLTKGTLGYEIYEEFQPMSDERIFDKNVNSAFKGTRLLDYLHEKGEDTIIIVGLQTDYCIDATVKCGFEHGFKMIVPANTNSTVDNSYMSAESSYKYYNEFMWNGRYAECISFEKTLELFSFSFHPSYIIN